MRTLNEARDVGHDKTAVRFDGDHAELWVERGKWIIRHLGAGRRQGPQQGRLASIGQTHQTNVCEHLQFEAQTTLFAHPPRDNARRRTVSAGFKTGITSAAGAALGHQQALLRGRQLTDLVTAFDVSNNRAQGHLDLAVRTRVAGTLPGTAALAIAGLKTAGIAEISEGVKARIADEPDTPSTATVTAVGSTSRDKLLAPETQLAVATVASPHDYLCFIDKLHDLDPEDFPQRPARSFGPKCA